MHSLERRFLFALARELGKTVGELLDTMDSSELVEWRVYFDLVDEHRKSEELAVKAAAGVEQRKVDRRAGGRYVKQCRSDRH
jgi:hypothetical protein